MRGMRKGKGGYMKRMGAGAARVLSGTSQKPRMISREKPRAENARRATRK